MYTNCKKCEVDKVKVGVIAKYCPFVKHTQTEDVPLWLIHVSLSPSRY